MSAESNRKPSASNNSNKSDSSSEDENSLLAGLTGDWDKITWNKHENNQNNDNDTDNGKLSTSSTSQSQVVPECAYISILDPSLLLYILTDRIRGIAFQLWPAAQLLCQFIEENKDQFNKRNCLELGSGCGLVGLLCASRVIQASKTIITDLPNVQTHLQANIAANSAIIHVNSSIMAKSLDWNSTVNTEIYDEIKQIDYILLSDCVYWQELFDGLIQTLVQLTDYSPNAIIYLSQTPRRVKIEGRFFKKLRKLFHCDVVKQQKETAESRQFVSIFKITRKAKITK